MMATLVSATNKYTKYIYILQEREHVGTGIVKIGRIHKQSYTKRFSAYPNGSAVICMGMVRADATKEAEDAVMHVLAATCKARADIGREYFEVPSLKAAVRAFNFAIEEFVLDLVTELHVVGACTTTSTTQCDDESEEDREDINRCRCVQSDQESGMAQQQAQIPAQQQVSDIDVQTTTSEVEELPSSLAQDVQFLLCKYVDCHRDALSSQAVKVMDFVVGFAEWCGPSRRTTSKGGKGPLIRTTTVTSLLSRCFNVKCDPCFVDADGARHSHPTFIFPTLMPQAHADSFGQLPEAANESDRKMQAILDYIQSHVEFTPKDGNREGDVYTPTTALKREALILAFEASNVYRTHRDAFKGTKVVEMKRMFDDAMRRLGRELYKDTTVNDVRMTLIYRDCRLLPAGLQTRHEPHAH